MQTRTIAVFDGGRGTLVGEVAITETGQPVVNEMGFMELNKAWAIESTSVLADKMISSGKAVVPISISIVPLRVFVRPTAYYWPDEDKLLWEDLTQQIASLKSLEVHYRAASAGLHVPTYK